MKSDKYYIFCTNIKKLKKTLQQFNQFIITMGVYIEGNKLVITTEPKIIYFDLYKKVN